MAKFVSFLFWISFFASIWLGVFDAIPSDKSFSLSLFFGGSAVFISLIIYSINRRKNPVRDHSTRSRDSTLGN